MKNFALLFIACSLIIGCNQSNHIELIALKTIELHDSQTAFIRNSIERQYVSNNIKVKPWFNHSQRIHYLKNQFDSIVNSTENENTIYQQFLQIRDSLIPFKANGSFMNLYDSIIHNIPPSGSNVLVLQADISLLENIIQTQLFSQIDVGCNWGFFRDSLEISNYYTSVGDSVYITLNSRIFQLCGVMNVQIDSILLNDTIYPFASESIERSLSFAVFNLPYKKGGNYKFYGKALSFSNEGAHRIEYKIDHEIQMDDDRE